MPAVELFYVRAVVNFLASARSVGPDGAVQEVGLASITVSAPSHSAAVTASVAAAGIASAAAVALLFLAPAVVKAPYVASGAGVGMLVGLTGVGGGSLMTPLLILLFGIHPASAVGTDLLYASATKVVGGGVHAGHGTVDWRLVRRLATGSIPATFLTVAVTHALGFHGDKSAHFLSVLLGWLLICAAASLLLRGWLNRVALARSPDLPDGVVLALTVALGVGLGVLITLTSVGAGALGVTILIFLYPKVPLARIVGADIVHAVPLTLIAGAAHWWVGEVNVPLMISLLCGSVPGIIVGSLLTPRIPEQALRPILAAVLVLSGVKLIG